MKINNTDSDKTKWLKRPKNRPCQVRLSYCASQLKTQIYKGLKYKSYWGVDQQLFTVPRCLGGGTRLTILNTKFYYVKMLILKVSVVLYWPSSVKYKSGALVALNLLCHQRLLKLSLPAFSLTSFSHSTKVLTLHTIDHVTLPTLHTVDHVTSSKQLSWWFRSHDRSCIKKNLRESC